MTTINRRDFISLAGPALGLLAGLPGTADAAPGKPITIAIPADLTTWDPSRQMSPTPIPIFKCVFDQLLTYSADSVLGPSLATDYKWSDRGLTLELNLRPDAVFHNGDPVTSADVKFTYLERPRVDKTLQIGFVWNTLKDIETPTPTKVIFRFKEAMVTAPQFMGYAGSFIVPKKYFEKVGLDGFLAKPVGSGPYRLVEYQRDSHIVLEAMEKFRDGPAKIPRVTFQVVKDPTSRASAIQSGQVDVSSGLSARDALRLGTLPKIGTSITPTVDTYMIHMINAGPLTDINVRLAMNHAIDKKGLSRAFFNGVAAPLTTPSAPGTPSYDPAFKFDFDPALAQSLLAKSGYSASKPVQFRFFAPNGVNSADFDMARAIVQMWKKVGIEATLEVIEPPQYFTRLGSGKLEGPTLWLWTNATGDPELSAGYYLNPKKAFSAWKTPDVSEKLDPLLVETDYDKRIEGYKTFHAWAVSQGYALPLVQGVATGAYGKDTIKYKPFRNGWLLPYEWQSS
ncbi:ABC transporter substrate-binding protein [soil metagenome]